MASLICAGVDVCQMLGPELRLCEISWLCGLVGAGASFQHKGAALKEHSLFGSLVIVALSNRGITFFSSNSRPEAENGAETTKSEGPNGSPCDADDRERHLQLRLCLPAEGYYPILCNLPNQMNLFQVDSAMCLG